MATVGRSLAWEQLVLFVVVALLLGWWNDHRRLTKYLELASEANVR